VPVEFIPPRTALGAALRPDPNHVTYSGESKHFVVSLSFLCHPRFAPFFHTYNPELKAVFPAPFSSRDDLETGLNYDDSVLPL